MYNGVYFGKLSEFVKQPKGMLKAEFAWNGLRGNMCFKKITAKNFIAEYEAESGETGHWKGNPIDLYQNKVQFRWHDNLVYEANFHKHEERSGYELQALRPMSPNIKPELQLETQRRTRKRKRKLKSLEPRTRKKSVNEKLQKQKRILRVLEEEPVKERAFETGRLVDVRQADGTWTCMRPVHYRGDGKYVVLSEDDGWDMVEAHEDDIREKLAPSFQWVGHDVFTSKGRAAIYKVDTKLRFIRVKLDQNGKQLEFTVDYDRIIPSTKLEAIMHEQRRKLEKRGEGRRHEVRFTSPKQTEDHGHINAPLDAGCVKFSRDLQQKTMDHAGVYFVNDEEFEERFPHDPDLDAYLPATCLSWTVNPPVKYFEKWSMKVQEKAFNAPGRGKGSLWHRKWRTDFSGEQIVGYRICKEEQFDRQAVHCVFAHWARVKEKIYYHDTLANVTAAHMNMAFSIGTRCVIAMQDPFRGAGKECLSLITPIRANLHDCKKMALHAAFWTLLPFYERFGYVTKWGLVFENMWKRSDIDYEEKLWEENMSHNNNVYMARLVC